jgi:hypothetical protein
MEFQDFLLKGRGSRYSLYVTIVSGCRFLGRSTCGQAAYIETTKSGFVGCWSYERISKHCQNGKNLVIICRCEHISHMYDTTGVA